MRRPDGATGAGPSASAPPRGRRAPGILALGAACLPSPAAAHSYEIAYQLPVPLWMYAYGAVATMAVTFVSLFFFGRQDAGQAAIIESAARRAAPALPLPLPKRSAIGAVPVLGAVILICLAGPADPAVNAGTALFWSFFLLGFAYASAMLGNFYPSVDPWRGLIAVLRWSGLDLVAPRLHLPAWLAVVFPAAAYLALLWVELFSGSKPADLGLLLLLYSLWVIAGCALFGAAAYFAKLDLFSAIFRLFSRLAGATPAGRGDAFRPDPSAALLVVAIIAATSFDAIHGSEMWVRFSWTIAESLARSLPGQPGAMASYPPYAQAGIVVLFTLYLASWTAVLAAARLLSRLPLSVRDLLVSFSPSLIPIALAYSFAHYFYLLAIQVQSLPHVMAATLATLAANAPAPSPPIAPWIAMNWVWHIQLFAILAGHIASIFMAHHTALRLGGTRLTAFLSELPIITAMLGYTIFGLWSLSLPLAL